MIPERSEILLFLKKEWTCCKRMAIRMTSGNPDIPIAVEEKKLEMLIRTMKRGN